MNLILLDPADLTDDHHAWVRDPRRLRHLREVHRARPGDELTLGVSGGSIGRGRLVSLDEDK